MAVLPVCETRRQVKRISVLLHPRPPQITLRAHIVQPPRQTVAVHVALRLLHDITAAGNRCQLSQPLHFARFIDAVHGHILAAAPRIAGRPPPADFDDLIRHAAQGA